MVLVDAGRVGFRFARGQGDQRNRGSSAGGGSGEALAFGSRLIIPGTLQLPIALINSWG